MTTEEKAQALNDYNEFIGTEKRFWLADDEDRYFICHNALSAMDELEEVDEAVINREYEKINKN